MKYGGIVSTRYEHCISGREQDKISFGWFYLACGVGFHVAQKLISHNNKTE